MVFILRLGTVCKANSADPDQTAPQEQSDQGLYCLPHSLYFYVSFFDRTSRFVRIPGVKSQALNGLHVEDNNYLQ